MSGSTEADIERFVFMQFPQIQMHGGRSSVIYDEDTGVVDVYLTGACDGCGISHMTVAALQNRLTDTFDDIETVYVNIGHEQSGGDIDTSGVPF